MFQTIREHRGSLLSMYEKSFIFKCIVTFVTNVLIGSNAEIKLSKIRDKFNTKILFLYLNKHFRQ